jgi:hypothetical protein
MIRALLRCASSPCFVVQTALLPRPLIYPNLTAKILFDTPLRGAQRREEDHAKKCEYDSTIIGPGPSFMDLSSTRICFPLRFLCAFAVKI